MIEALNLPNYIFSNTKLEGLKRKNFIYGRNGTGKSSIAKAINEQYGQAYDVRIFLEERVLFMKVKALMQLLLDVLMQRYSLK